MIPIHEQGYRKGIGKTGHSLETFLRRFDEICTEKGSKRSFAFIFYDFRDSIIKKILKDEGVFVELDRLSEKKLSIFFLHAASENGTRRFNRAFLSKLGLKGKVELPCVVFFKLNDSEVTDVTAVTIGTDLIQGFHELYEIINQYLKDEQPKQNWKVVRYIKSALTFVSLELLRAEIRSLLTNHIPQL